MLLENALIRILYCFHPNLVKTLILGQIISTNTTLYCFIVFLGEHQNDPHLLCHLKLFFIYLLGNVETTQEPFTGSSWPSKNGKQNRGRHPWVGVPGLVHMSQHEGVMDITCTPTALRGLGLCFPDSSSYDLVWRVPGILLYSDDNINSTESLFLEQVLSVSILPRMSVCCLGFSLHGFCHLQ